MAYSASFCDWSAEEGRRVIGQTIPSPFPNARIVTIKQPIGVVGMITPWNFPVGISVFESWYTTIDSNNKKSPLFLYLHPKAINY